MNMIINKEAATLERTSANEGVQLQSLTLSEGTIRFEPDVTDYNVTVAEDVTKILVKGVTSDENSFYTVSGNTNLVKGKNEIVVTVTDKDGNIGHYYIHVQVGFGYFSIARLLCQHKNSIFSKNLPHPGCAGHSWHVFSWIPAC